MELGVFVKRWDLKKENNMRWENEKNGYLFSFIKEGILIQTCRNCCAPCEGTIKLKWNGAILNLNTPSPHYYHPILFKKWLLIAYSHISLSNYAIKYHWHFYFLFILFRITMCKFYLHSNSTPFALLMKCI